MITNQVIRAWTDGACAGNPGPGGYGAIIVIDGIERELRGGEIATTNNRMEMLAAIVVLEARPRERELFITVDSQYVKQGAESWVTGWKRRGWKTAKGEPVKNRDLWRQPLG